MNRLVFGIAAVILTTTAAPAQSPTPSPSSIPSPMPSGSPAPRRARMTMPKGWVPVQGDTVAKFVFRSPSAAQDIRVAPLGPDKSFTGDAALQKIREMAAHFGFAQTDVSQTTVCDGIEPAFLTVAKDAKQQTVMEQVFVMGTTGGAIITYEIMDGKPDPAAEQAIHSVCIP